MATAGNSRCSNRTGASTRAPASRSAAERPPCRHPNPPTPLTGADHEQEPRQEEGSQEGTRQVAEGKARREEGEEGEVRRFPGAPDGPAAMPALVVSGA